MLIVSYISILLLLLCTPLTAQNAEFSTPINPSYSNARLAFRYTPPSGMRDKTEDFRLQIAEGAKVTGKRQTLSALLAMSSGKDSSAPGWGSVTIETYPRDAVPEPDDSKAEAQMNALVAHSRDTGVLPKSAIISGQRFTVSVFGLREGAVRKGAVVWTTVRKRKLLSFAFAANSPAQLRELTESMKTVQFF